LQRHGWIILCYGVTNVSSTVCFNGSEVGPIKLMLSQFILELFSKVYLFFSFPIKKLEINNNSKIIDVWAKSDWKGFQIYIKFKLKF
jgi:hypothetical protein